MIKGIGTDIVKISRIAKALENPRFLERFFTQEEYAYFQSKDFAPRTIAANFAMKEAVVKALGTGFRHLAVKDVAILRDPLGRPILQETAPLRRAMDQVHVTEIQVSCAHEDAYAVAFAIAQ